MRTPDGQVRHDASYLKTLPPEEFGALVLREIVRRETQNGHRWLTSANEGLHRQNFFNPADPESLVCVLQGAELHEAGQLLMEGWNWLECNGLIAAWHGNPAYVNVTRKGAAFLATLDTASLKRHTLLQAGIFHAELDGPIRSAFLRGEFRNAIEQAYSHLESRLRSCASNPSLTAVPLARDLFNPSSGALADAALQRGEAQALSDLFAGAMGWFRNLAAHRKIAASEVDAIEALALASYLLRYLDDRQGEIPRS